MRDASFTGVKQDIAESPTQNAFDFLIENSSELSRFHFWSRMPKWSLDEAAFLSLGFEPGNFGQIDSRHSKLLTLCRCAAGAGLLTDPVSPRGFIAWAKEGGLPFPEELEKFVIERSIAWVNWKAEAERLETELVRAENAFAYYKRSAERKYLRVAELEAEVTELKTTLSKIKGPGAANPRSFNTLLKLVGGMAVSVYGFNANDRRGDTAAQIQGDLDLKGIRMDADTIRKWVREGVKLLELADSDAGE